MTARYKLHKLKDKWNDGFYKPKTPNPDSVERRLAKKEIREELDSLVRFRSVERELEIERIEAEAWECYLKEQADPNYVCRCFED